MNHTLSTKIAITGTSGKTSVCQIMAQALDLSGEKTGTVGTLGVGFVQKIVYESGLTTPDALTLQQYFTDFERAGASVVVFEASSHGIHQGRIVGTVINTAVFTNLTQDHLDYHKTIEAYGAVKAQLFQWPDLQRAIINVDDPFGVVLAQKTSAKRLITTSIQSTSQQPADLKVQEAHYDLNGIQATVQTPWGLLMVHSGLLGSMNLSNLLAVVAYLGDTGRSLLDIESLLPQLKPIPGRLERYGGNGKPVVFVDYAHKPDPLKQIVQLLNQLKSGRLFCVIGCGGDRDKMKRPLMAEAASEADVTVITSDNPRTEDPWVIMADMNPGLSRATNVYKNVDRAAAIEYAILQAAQNDIVLVAGRGNETDQIIGDLKIPFQDSEHVKKALYSWHD